MVNFDDLIKYENENTSLDFKAVQYKKKQYEALIKDIMSMANADIENDRYIIVGVKHKSSGNREILDIKKEDFIDSATYQQVIIENIESEINLDYFHYELEDKLLGIFKISKCFDKPYMMKKDFKKLKKGDCFIRKGSQQSRMGKRDFDRITENRIKKQKFDGIVQLSFSGYNSYQEIELTTVGDIELPSKRATEKIKKIIKEKRKLAKMNTQMGPSKKLSPIESQESTLEILRRLTDPFEQMSIEQLEIKKNLIEVLQTYRDDDDYKFFELKSHKINVSILNQGHTYIEDASIQLEIEKTDGLFIADRIYGKPKKDTTLIIKSLSVPSYESTNYPKVDYTKSSIIVYQTIGDVKHHISINAFKVPIRVVLLDRLAGKVIEIKCKIFGKNLIEPLNDTLRIKAVPKSQ